MKKFFGMMFCAVAAVTLLCGAKGGCDDSDSVERREQDRNIETAHASIPIPRMSYFQERRTIAKWAQRWDTPNLPCYIYLIAYNTVTKKFTTAVFDPGERHKDADELMFIWNKMHELAESGQLDEIASGDDELKDPVPVFSFRDQKIVKTFTERDEFGWPHCDNEGYLMYDNTAFRTERECRLYAIGLLTSNLDFCLQNLESDIEQLARRVKFFSSEAKALRQLYKEMRKDENASADKQPDGM